MPTGDGKSWGLDPVSWVQFLWPVPESLDAVLSLEQASCLERGDRPILPLLPLPLPNNFRPEEQHRGDGWLGRGSSPSWMSGLTFHCLEAWRYFLQKWGKKNKQLSSGQLFSKAHPLSWKTIKSYLFRWCLYQQGLKYFMTSCKTWAKAEGLPASGALCIQFDHNHLG